MGRVSYTAVDVLLPPTADLSASLKPILLLNKKPAFAKAMAGSAASAGLNNLLEIKQFMKNRK